MEAQIFHTIPQPILDRMAYLESIDARDREDGTPRLQRLRQIPMETGKFLALLAANAPAGEMIEIGASAGYSSLWLALACRQRGDRLVTFEILEDKARLAEETFTLAGVDSIVQLIRGNALDYLPQYRQVAFCFLDAEKEVYRPCYDIVVPNLVSGGLLVADNAINHRLVLQPLLEHALSDPRLDALVVPIGKGELVCRKI